MAFGHRKEKEKVLLYKQAKGYKTESKNNDLVDNGVFHVYKHDGSIFMILSN